MPSKKESKKEPYASKASSSKKKKDPNVPKRAMSSFMYFSQTEREVRFAYGYYCCSVYPLLSIIILIRCDII